MDIYFFTRLFLRFFFHTFYKFRVIGIDHIYKGGAFIACNHSSYYDPALLSVAWPERLHFLAEEPLFRNRLFGFYIRKLNAHPIHGSIQDLSTFKIIKKLLKSHQKIIMFPEGIRSHHGLLHPFKPGLAKLALHTNTPIIPAYIDGLFHIWSRHKSLPKLGGNITCAFGKPLFPESYQHFEKKEAVLALTRDLYQAVENLRLEIESTK